MPQEAGIWAYTGNRNPAVPTQEEAKRGKETQKAGGRKQDANIPLLPKGTWMAFLYK